LNRQTLPGGDLLEVNVANGNVLLESADVLINHRGVPLALVRAYNSQSSHDVHGSDGTPPSLFGNGWTNTLDAHVSGTIDGTISVYDGDGTRYLYTNSAPQGSAPAYAPQIGTQAYLVFDGSCGLWWQKQDGTTYYFYRPDLAQAGAACQQALGYAGRLYQLVGRNQYDVITLTYSWVGGNSGANGQISQITASTEAGMTLTMNFGAVGTFQLLQNAVLPDGTSVQYSYDSFGDLIQVSWPPNNGSGNRIVKEYEYTAGSNSANLSSTLLSTIASPRWEASAGTDGSYVALGYNGFALSAINHYGWMDPSPNDGLPAQSPIQPSPGNGADNASQPFLAEAYNVGQQLSSFVDSSGHVDVWVFSGNQVVQRQECTASGVSVCTSSSGNMLITDYGWTDLRVTSEIDPRGYESDFLYDTNGDLVATAGPLTVNAAGTFRPTVLMSYDANYNLTAACDPDQTHSLGLDWGTAPPTAPVPGSSPGLCPQTSTATQLTYTYPPYEPLGELQSESDPASASAPGGYTTTFAYAAAAQGGLDYGQPTSFAGGSNGSDPSPSLTIQYDSEGQIACYSFGNSAWLNRYDSNERLILEDDPDDAPSADSTPATACSRTPGNDATAYSYFSDGSLASSQTSQERANNAETSYTYDADQDVTSTTSSVAGTPHATSFYYDGADRLVEVAEPHDPTDFWANGPATRYLYDLTRGGTVTSPGTAPSGMAFGHMYAIERFVAQQWSDLRDIRYDGANRIVARFDDVPGTSTLRSTATTYDQPGAEGLPYATTVSGAGTGQTTLYTFDPSQNLVSLQFSPATDLSLRSYSYTAGGRLASATDALSGTESYQYDLAGQLILHNAPSRIGAVSTSYAYDPNGWKRSESISGVSPQIQYSFSYRNDGAPVGATLSYGTTSYNFGWTYSNEGRVLTQSDPYASPSLTLTYTNFLPTSEVIPSATYSLGPYDATGHLLGFSVPSYSTQIALHYNVRGEVVEEDNGGMPISKAQSAFGVLIPTNAVDNIDAVSAVKLSETATPAPNVSPPSTTTSRSWQFDGLGRQTAATETDSTFTGLTSSGPCTNDTTINSARTYGTANLLTHYNSSSTTQYCNGTSSSSATTSQSYTWDAMGDLVEVTPQGTNPRYPTYDFSERIFHDVDGTILFTEGDGIDDVKLASLGDVTTANPSGSDYTGLTVHDRDFAGAEVAWHNSSGHSPWSLGAISPYGYDSYSNQTSTGITPIENGTTSSFSDGAQIFQGARVFDPNQNAWTVPDPNAGEAANPMSLLPYTYEDNDSENDTDPSGDATLSCYHTFTGAGGSDGSGWSYYDNLTCVWLPTMPIEQLTLSSLPQLNAKALVNIGSTRTKRHVKTAAEAMMWLYLAIGKNGARYWGITNNIVRRTNEWARLGRTITASYNLGEVSRDSARVAEQAAIEIDGTMVSEGGLNQISSVAASNPLYPVVSQVTQAVSQMISSAPEEGAAAAESVGAFVDEAVTTIGVP
jgi:YD repeat-containing protein